MSGTSTATRGSGTGPGAPNRYYGKYRGTVIDNIDLEQRARIIAQVPDVLGEIPSSWALPCAPAAGIQSGMFIVPPIGSGVWIEFEQGNPDYPIWTGGILGSRGRCAGTRNRPARNPARTEYRLADHR